MSKSLLTVFGAQGQQGASVIHTVQANSVLSSKWNLRGITRDVNGQNALGLASEGVDVVYADLERPETLLNAVRGSDAVFAVTLTIPDTEAEIEQGKAIVDACIAAKVRHLIWSSVPSPSKTSGGKLLNVLHFESKVKVMEYIESVKGKGDKFVASYFVPSTYMSNFERNLAPNADGVRLLNFPWGHGDRTAVPLLDAGNDTGLYVAALLTADPGRIDGLHAQAVTEWLTPNEIAQILTEATGKPFKYNEVSSQVFGGFLPAAISLRMTEMMENLRDYSYFGVDANNDQARLDAGLGITDKSSLARWARESKIMNSL
ncbi:hypothetical protein CBS101457_000701 [Exobasidium rhododendri]|nr:hypothetical protein CBS101457_000701 [Exobasidium rhododendri]